MPRTRYTNLDSPAWEKLAADLVQAAARSRSDAVIGVPTGRTPLPLYAELCRRGLPGTRFCMLDEYVGAPDGATTFYAWLRRELFDPLGVGPERVLRITPDVAAFERTLADWGGLDLLFLGLGSNGHVGFNEPGSGPDSPTRVVSLSAETAAANAAYWQGKFTPKQAVTMGLATMLRARTICLLARGAAKASILREALFGPITPAVPASQLRLAGDLIVIADRAAAPLE